MTGAYWDDPNFLYGDATRHYDEAPAGFDSERWEWRFEVAWDSYLHYYSESNGRSEADRVVDDSWKRGRDSFVNYDGNGLTQFPPGRMTITLENDDGRYDPSNAASSLYPYIAPGKFCRLGVRRAGSTDYSAANSYAWRFTGVIVDFQTREEGSGAKFVEISVEDGWSWLINHQVYLPVETAANIATFMGKILTAVQWPWGTDFGTAETLPYAWADGRDARAVLHDLAAAVGGRVYIKGNGDLAYRRRVFAPYAVQVLAEADVLKDIPRSKPWEHLFNLISLAYRENPSLYESLPSAVWGDSYSGGSDGYTFTARLTEITIAAAEEIVLGGGYKKDSLGSIPAGDLVFAFASADAVEPILAFGTGPGSTGVDVSGAVTVEFQDGGTAHQTKIKNRYAATVYSRVLAIIGDLKLSVLTKLPEIKIDLSNGAAGKLFQLASSYLIKASPLTAAELSSIASYYASLVGTSRVLPKVTVESNPTKQFIDVMDWVALLLPSVGISDDFYAGMVEERWLTPTGQNVQTTIQTEPEIQTIYGFLLMETGDRVLQETGDKIMLG